MRAFLGIVKLTVHSAVRSHIFQLLLLLLLLCVWLIPTAISGDGTAAGFIQISLLYSLSAISMILSLSSVWVGCFVMTQDIDSYQLHMVVTKPVSRLTVWTAKMTGVLSIHLVLLLLSATAVYFTILTQFARQDFKDKERERIENEVLVGRRVFLPTRPDIDALAREEVKKRLIALQKEGKEPDMSPQAQEQMLAEQRKRVLAQLSEVRAGQSTGWMYENLPEKFSEKLYLRYRPYINKIATEGQRFTHGLWSVGIPQVDKEKQNVFEEAKRAETRVYLYPMTQGPEQFRSGVFHEKVLPPKVVTPDRKVYLAYMNADGAGATQYFQTSDGPRLLMKVTGFSGNYFRAVLVLALQVAIMTGLGCAAGAVLTLPTAIFVVISYILFGSFATYMVGNTYFGGAADYIGYYVGRVLLLAVIPLQDFGVTEMVANGELVEFSLIGRLALAFLVLRALPLWVVGALIYRRRELGLVIRK